MSDQVIRVYVCPSPECGNYYGSSEMGQLESAPNLNLKGEITHFRDRCPDCGHQRQLRYARLVAPEDQAKAMLQVMEKRPWEVPPS